MKRRSERARLQRLSVVNTGNVGKATSEPVDKAGNASKLACDIVVGKATSTSLVPVSLVEKPIQLQAVSVPRYNLPLLLLSCCIWLVGLGVNGWYNWNLGTTLIRFYCLR